MYFTNFYAIIKFEFYERGISFDSFIKKKKKIQIA